MLTLNALLHGLCGRFGDSFFIRDAALEIINLLPHKDKTGYKIRKASYEITLDLIIDKAITKCESIKE